MLYKDFNVEYKDTDTGMICGYASTFDRVPDAYFDVVKKGAFAKSLARIEEEGKTIPFLWAHRMDDLGAYLGSCKAYEDDHGLYFEATLDDTPEAQRVRQLFKDGRLSKFSFAYNVLDEGPITLENGIKANELREVEIYEITACLVPANSFAEVTDVKSGKRNSAKDENTIKDAIKLLQSLLEDLVDDIDEDDTEEKCQTECEEKEDSDNEASKDQGLLNLQKFELLQLIKKYEKLKK